MDLRGTTRDEIVKTINEGVWGKAKLNKLKSKLTFEFNSYSRINNKYYEFKTLESYFCRREKSNHNYNSKSILPLI